MNYNLWSGPAPILPLHSAQVALRLALVWAYGNGDLGNQGIHQMDIARWGLGVDTVSPAVVSYGGRFGYVDAGETANTQVIIHDYGPQNIGLRSSRPGDQTSSRAPTSA